MIKRGVELINGVRAKRVAYFGAIECNTNGSLVDSAMVCDVGE